MNTLSIIFSVFVLVSSGIGYCMLIPTVETIFQIEANHYRQFPLFFKQREFSAAKVESFIDNFSKSALSTLSKKLLHVCPADGVRILALVNDNQKFLMRISFLPEEVQLSIVAILFNGNRDCSRYYCSHPIGQMLDHYACNEKLRNVYSGCAVKRHLKLPTEIFHCSCLYLTSSHIHILHNALWYGTISKRDAVLAGKAIKKLNAVTSSEWRDDINRIASSIKIRPSTTVWLNVISYVFKNFIYSSYTELGEILALMALGNLYPHEFIDILFPGFSKMFNRKECHHIVRASQRFTLIVLLMFSMQSLCEEFHRALGGLYKRQASLLDYSQKAFAFTPV